MASSPAMESVTEAPLSFMKRLSPTVSLHDPSDTMPPLDHDAPKLILILSWFAARDVHVAKYISRHQALFPASRILLVRCPVGSIFYPPGVGEQLRPAVQVLRAHLDQESNDGGCDGAREKMIVHVFSNGGITTLVRLLDMMKTESSAATPAPPPMTFPRHVLLLDSCPGYFHWQRTHRAIAHALPAWASPLIHLSIALNWLLFAPWGCDPPPDVNARVLNSDHFLALQSRRLYLYGTGDDMVDWRDVELHAAHATERGAHVRREIFPGGNHVAHVRIDAQRYWQAVEDVWDGKG